MPGVGDSVLAVGDELPQRLVDALVDRWRLVASQQRLVLLEGAGLRRLLALVAPLLEGVGVRGVSAGKGRHAVLGVSFYDELEITYNNCRDDNPVNIMIV